MISKKQKFKIATVLPYKENYSFEHASAASLWVAEFFDKSIFKKENYIYGNTKSKNYLTKNYINIDLKNINSRFKSSTKEYSIKLIKEINDNKYDLVEIHNRPLVLFNLINKINCKLIFYFHNDPLSMKGSKLPSERLLILKNVDKIIFVSKWVQKRFFYDLDKRFLTKTEVIYPSVKNRKTVKKEKHITFVGRLNYSKGYDLFKNAIIPILDEFPEWKAFSIGNESRRKIYINHENHYELGFLNHNDTLKYIDKSELVIVPSKWEEPFGRVSLEAASCGCATIISNSGGLPETNDHAIILKYNDASNIYNEIKNLIINKKKRTKIQKLSKKNIKHTITNNTKKIDKIRNETFLKKIIYKKRKIKILHITNFNERFDGRLHYNTSKRLNNGFIRNGHNVLSMSDRDLLQTNKSLFDVKGIKSFNQKIIRNFINFLPDLVVLGHADSVTKETILKIKELKDVKICQWFLDPVSIDGPDYKKNKNRILNLDNYIDKTFLTTSPNVLNFKIQNSYFIPNPSDNSFETLNNEKKKQKKDLFFAMSHGVHRGRLKKGKVDDREKILKKLENTLDDTFFDFFGYKNNQPIWGDEFLETLKDYDMGLNLSRGKPIKFYSSDRIVQIIGNGLLCFINTRTQLQKIIPKGCAVYYKDTLDLSKKIKFYKKNVKLMKQIARKGKKFYSSNFNSSIVSQYIIDTTLGINHKYKYSWIKK